MIRVVCIMMQKNERDLLEPWFRYHGYLFGFENLHVLDNGSSDPGVVEILQRYERAGSTIYWSYQSKDNFENKGEIIKNLSEDIYFKIRYDLIFPLDCDEFICLMQDGGLTSTKHTILTYLIRLKEQKKALIVSTGLQNIPNKPGWFKVTNIPKGFFSGNTISYLDHGFHHPRSSAESGRYITNLAYVHLHNRSFEKVKNFALEKLRHLVDVNDLEQLRVKKGHGEHLTKYFFMTESEYISQCDADVTVYFGEFVNSFFALGIEPKDTVGDFNRTFMNVEANGGCILKGQGPDGSKPSVFCFDIKQYAELNPDIPYSSALHHYIWFGFKEGRPHASRL